MRWLPTIFLTCGCVDGPGEPFELPPADAGLFEETVEPVLGAGCGNPSCHGSSDRALEVYAPRLHRIDPLDTHRDTPLTDEEHRRNFERACAFLVDVTASEDCALLVEPRTPDRDGPGHAGGVVFEDEDDPGYRAILAWVEDAIAAREEP